ncbi:LysM domain-containing protein [Clostridium aestuarii]|uniref:LysM domain-containing protein n=1 Tax=Clostridium aestuarii TaxID=338193 RepID=A0ABT4CZ16_9CLOT|nr:LysM domain-containing protein [Clostridium aestuarii]MCY6483365.1 LysM domain-containing protein [Clostridium aestuarii]
MKKFKKPLILICSGIVLFLGVFFMTRSLNNLIQASNTETPISIDKNSVKSNSNEKDTKLNEQKNTETQPDITNDKDSKEEDKSDSKDTATLYDEKHEYYTVKSGDSLYSIAKTLMPWSSINNAKKMLIEINDIKNSEILPVGVHLLIPENPIDTENCIKYTIGEGDTLYNVAQKYFPTSNPNNVVSVIMEKNNINDPTSVTEDRVIYIPKNYIDHTQDTAKK